jgi:hypothetical protein
MKKRLLKRLVLTIQSKGSVGKSTFLAAFIEWVRLSENAPRMAVFDPDTENQTLFKIFGLRGAGPLEPPHSAQMINWRGDFGSVVLDDLIRSMADDGPADLAILDGVANQADDVLHWLNDIKLFDQAKRFGFGVTVVIPVDETQDSSVSAGRVVSAIGGRTDVVVVHSHKVWTRLPWESALEQAVAQGAKIDRLHSISVERFAADVAGYMSGFGTGLPHSLWQATQQDRNSMLRSRAESYWERLVPSLSLLAPVLLPANVDEPAAKEPQAPKK